jgi:hypothetical protein
MIRNLVIFYGEELLVPRPTTKLEDHPFSAVRDCLFNVFAATLHIQRPFLHPQPEDAPCRDDREPLVMEWIGYLSKKQIDWWFILLKLLTTFNLRRTKYICMMLKNKVVFQRKQNASPLQTQIG